jgi:hypothetical protein
MSLPVSKYEHHAHASSTPTYLVENICVSDKCFVNALLGITDSLFSEKGQEPFAVSPGQTLLAMMILGPRRITRPIAQNVNQQTVASATTLHCIPPLCLYVGRLSKGHFSPTAFLGLIFFHFALAEALMHYYEAEQRQLRRKKKCPRHTSNVSPKARRVGSFAKEPIVGCF